MDSTSTRLPISVPCQLSAVSASETSIYMSVNTSGLFSPSTNQIGLTSNGTLRFNVGPTAIPSSLGIVSPTYTRNPTHCER